MESLSTRFISHTPEISRDRTQSKLNHTPAVDLELEDLFCILQVSPYDSGVAIRLAERLIEAHRLEEAYKVMRGVIRIDSRFETLYSLGMIEYQLELNDAAYEHLQQALILSSDENQELFELFKTLGNIHVRKGDLDSGEDNYHKAHRINPYSDSLLVNLGTLSIQRQQWDQALENFRQALDLNVQNDKAWIGLAIGHQMKGDFELAWANLETALQYNPRNDVAVTLILDWSASSGREFRALEYVRRFLVQGGWSEKLSLAFVWLSWKRGERKVARLELERLLAVNPKCERALELIELMRADH